MNDRVRRVGWLSMLCLLVAAAAGAQALTGTFIGMVKDESGAVLPGVTITITSPALPAGPVTTTTDAQGEYRFPLLPPGLYTLATSLSGFSDYKEEGLRVIVGGTIERIVTLKLGSVTESITVSGQAPMVDPRKVGTTVNLPKETFELIPTHRRYLNEQTKFSPGVSSRDPSGSGITSVGVLGSSANDNTTQYEGASVDVNGSAYTATDHDAVQEVQITMLGASAEYQAAQGYVLSAVYREGTNAFHYDGAIFYAPNSLASSPVKVNCNCPDGETGYSVPIARNMASHMGGPIVRDHAWFFGGLQYTKEVELPPGTYPAIYKTNRFQYRGANKVSWQVNKRLRLQQFIQWGPRGGAPNTTPSVASPYETITASYGHTKVFSTEMNAMLSPNTLVTARFGGLNIGRPQNRPLTDPSSSVIYSDSVQPIRSDSITGFTCCGVASVGDSANVRKALAVKINRFVKGSSIEHDLRGGFKVESQWADSRNRLPQGVNYADASGRPDQATFRLPYVNKAAWTGQGVWAEDQLTIGGRLTLNIGGRYDRMKGTSPDGQAVDALLNFTGATIAGLGDLFTWNVFAPRLGFNLKLTGDGKSVARGSYGRAYREVFLSDFQQLHPGLSPTTLARWNPATSAYSTIISVTDPIANLAIDSNLDAPYTDSYSIGADREVMNNLVLGTSYVHKRGERQVGSIDIGGVYGTQTTVLPDGRTMTVYPLLNATGARKYLTTNPDGLFMRYNALIVSMTKRMSHRWQATVNYTFSKGEGLVTSGTLGRDPNDRVNLEGLTSLDRPHLLGVNTAYQIPKAEVQLAVSMLASNGTPFAPQASVTLPQGRRTINIAPPDGSYRMPSSKLLYVRANKRIPFGQNRSLELGAELQNVLQDTGNYDVVSQNFFSSTFAQAAAWVEPRRLQTQLKVRW